MLISQWPESGLRCSFPVELTKLNNRNINKHEIWHVYIFCLLNVQRHIIFSLTLLLLVLLMIISPTHTLQYIITTTCTVYIPAPYIYKINYYVITTNKFIYVLRNKNKLLINVHVCESESITNYALRHN